MKKPPLLVLLFVAIMGCNKNSDNFGQSVYVTIESPYLEEKLIELGIDSDGEVNQLALKSDIESITELRLDLKTEEFFMPYNDVDCPESRYPYDLEANSITKGIEEFSNLKTLILTIESCRRYGIIRLAEINNMDKLEEVYYNNYWVDSEYAMKIKNCPNLKKIGTAVPTTFQEEYGDYFTINETNFDDDEAFHIKFLKNTERDGIHSKQLVIGNFELENLPNLESIELFNSWFAINNSNTPIFKKMFLLNDSKKFVAEGSTPPLFDGIEEFYFYTNNFTYYGESRFILNLSNFPDIRKFYLSYSDAYTSILGDEKRIDVKNSNNLTNDLQITLKFRNNQLIDSYSGAEHFKLCLDDDITPEFLVNNLTVITTDGTYDGTVIDTSCD